MRRLATVVPAVVLGLSLLAPARADRPIRIDVTYSGCSIVEGPLSLGLSALPDEIHATFVILAPTWPPPIDTPFDPVVLSASLILGDLHMNEDDLAFFTIAFSIPEEQPLQISELTYLGAVDETDTAKGLEVPNSSFEINITGTDTASDEFFHYRCTTSSQTFEVLPQNLPPDCTNAAPSLDELWPPNHKFVPVTITGVTDPDGDPVTITIDSIFHDEPVTGRGQGAGNTSPDGKGVGTSTAEVRAERNGNRRTPGNGRFYHITFTADDGNGGTCTATVKVCVPHDQKPGHVCGDEGALFDSTGGS